MLCWVITLGEFTGGHLRLYDVNVEFRMGNGSVAAFKTVASIIQSPNTKDNVTVLYYLSMISSWEMV